MPQTIRARVETPPPLRAMPKCLLREFEWAPLNHHQRQNNYHCYALSGTQLVLLQRLLSEMVLKKQKYVFLVTKPKQMYRRTLITTHVHWQGLLFQFLVRHQVRFPHDGGDAGNILNNSFLKLMHRHGHGNDPSHRSC